MPDSIISFFIKEWPKATIVILIAIAIIWFTIYMTKKITHWTNKINDAHKKCDDVHIKYDVISDKIDSVIMPKLDNMEKSLIFLGANINGLVIYLKGKDVSMDASLFKSQSPTQLTALGEHILIESGGKDFIDNNLGSLLKEITNNNIKTALDVQTIAPIIISNISNNDSFTNIKDFIYKNPRYKAYDNEENTIYLDMNIITNIMGIYLRNKYLEIHPELDPRN